MFTESGTPSFAPPRPESIISYRPPSTDEPLPAFSRTPPRDSVPPTYTSLFPRVSARLRHPNRSFRSSELDFTPAYYCHSSREQTCRTVYTTHLGRRLTGFVAWSDVKDYVRRDRERKYATTIKGRLIPEDHPVYDMDPSEQERLRKRGIDPVTVAEFRRLEGRR